MGGGSKFFHEAYLLIVREFCIFVKYGMIMRRKFTSRAGVTVDGGGGTWTGALFYFHRRIWFSWKKWSSKNVWGLGRWQKSIGRLAGLLFPLGFQIGFGFNLG